MASLRADGRYWERKRIKGRKTPVAGYGSTPEEAQADLARKIAEILNPTPTWVPSPDATLRSFVVNVWRPAIDRMEETSVKRYTASWRKFLNEQLGPIPLQDIRRAELDMWQRDLEAKKVPAPSIRYAAAVLSNILRMAVDYELIVRNPVASMKLPKKTAKRDRRLTVDQASELLEKSKGTLLSGPVFMACILGLRRGEIAGLRWEDLDRQRGELRIRRQRRASKGNGVIEKRLKTDSSIRTLRLPKKFIDEIDTRGDLDSPWICAKGEGPVLGAQACATPVVGCSQASTGRPPGGAGASGTITSAETGISPPSSPVEA